jgi:hypothetical protein
LKSTPVLRMERLYGWENRRSGMASYPCPIVCVDACAETPRALMLSLKHDLWVGVVVV